MPGDDVQEPLWRKLCDLRAFSFRYCAVQLYLSGCEASQYPRPTDMVLAGRMVTELSIATASFT